MGTKHTIITVHTSDTSYRVAPKSEKVFRKELDTIQQRCTVRTIDADVLFKAIVFYEKSLSYFLSYKDKEGKIYYHGLGNKVYFDKDLTMTYSELTNFSKSLFED